MIVELFSDEVKGALKPSYLDGDVPSQLKLEDLDPIFSKMGLVTPVENENVIKTSEGGYNLMLNQYGAVLRLYPSPRGVDEQGNRTAHGYHPRTLSPIGIVQFDGFVMQLMPAISHSIDGDDTIGDAMKETQADTGMADTAPENYGSVDGKAKLLDTVIAMDFSLYDKYASSGILDRLLEEYRHFEDLQQGFYDAWTGEKPFEAFWAEMETAKEEGRLVNGWDHSHLSTLIGKKGDIAAIARAYERRSRDASEELEM